MNYFLFFLVALVIYIAFIAYPLVRAKQIDSTLISESISYTLNDPAKRVHILVLGDSTAVGVGARPEESTAALLGKYLNASVENHAKSGAVSKDIENQAAKATRNTYDLILVQVGANDIIGMKSLSGAAKSMQKTLGTLRLKSDRVLVLTAGDIGKAPLFRWPLSAVISYRTRELRALFMQVCKDTNVEFLDIYSKPDLISADPARYHSSDGLHLSAAGYEYWYELIVEALERWPELTKNSAEKQS